MVTVNYLKAIRFPSFLAGMPGDVRELPEVFARKLIADKYVREVVIAVEPTVYTPEAPMKPKPTGKTPVLRKKKRRSRAKKTKTGDER